MVSRADYSAMTIAVDLEHKATNKQYIWDGLLFVAREYVKI